MTYVVHKETEVLAGDAKISEELREQGYFRTLCFKSDQGDFIDLCVTRKQIEQLRQLIDDLLSCP